MTSPTSAFSTPLTLILLSLQGSTTFSSRSLSSDKKKILRWPHPLLDQQKHWTVPPQRTFFQPFKRTLPCTNICWIQCSWYMKPVFPVNILPNFLAHVLHPNLPLFMHLPYPPQYNLRICPTEHSNYLNLTLYRSFYRCNQLAYQKTCQQF